MLLIFLDDLFFDAAKNPLLKKHLDGRVTFVYEYTHAREV